MGMAGMLLDVMDIGGDAIVFVDVTDAVETHLVVAARADHAVAVNHPVQTLMKSGPAVPAANADFVMLDLMGVRIGHGVALSLSRCAKRLADRLPCACSPPRCQCGTPPKCQTALRV